MKPALFAPLFLLWAALAVHGWAVSWQTRASADVSGRLGDHLRLDGAGSALSRGWHQLVSRLKQWALDAPTDRVKAFEARAGLLSAWREWHDARAGRAAKNAALAGLALLAGGALAGWRLARGRRAAGAWRGLALSGLACALACLAVGLASPCLSLALQYDDLPLLGSVSIKASSSGVVDSLGALWKGGNYALALPLFFFSMVFPAAKAALMLAAVCRRPREGGGMSRAFHGAVVLGKWSMLDVMVVAILFVQLTAGRQEGMAARLEWGALFFGAHVLLAMGAGWFLQRWFKGQEPAPDAFGQTPAGRRAGPALVRVLLWAAGGWSAWQAAEDAGQTAPGRLAAWNAGHEAYRSGWWGGNPFRLDAVFTGLPGWTEGRWTATAHGAGKEERRSQEFVNWPEGEKRTMEFPALAQNPVRVVVVITAREADQHAMTLEWRAEPP